MKKKFIGFLELERRMGTMTQDYAPDNAPASRGAWVAIIPGWVDYQGGYHTWVAIIPGWVDYQVLHCCTPAT